MRALAIPICILWITFLSGCSQSDKQNASQRAEEAKVKARQDAERLKQDAKKLGQQAKQEAHALNQDIATALNSTGTNGTAGAQEKLAKAGVKLDHAALIAKVKARLAMDAGLNTVTGVDVDTTGQVVTLRGTVNSVEQKQLAEQAALQVNGVTRVIDQLQVRP